MFALRLAVSFLLLFTWTVFALAAVSQGQNSPTWFEHVDLMQVMIGGLFAAVLFFLTRTLKKIDYSQSCLFAKYDNHEHRLSTLEGAHSARVGIGSDCATGGKL